MSRPCGVKHRRLFFSKRRSEGVQRSSSGSSKAGCTSSSRQLCRRSPARFLGGCPWLLGDIPILRLCILRSGAGSVGVLLPVLKREARLAAKPQHKLKRSSRAGRRTHWRTSSHSQTFHLILDAKQGKTVWTECTKKSVDCAIPEVPSCVVGPATCSRILWGRQPRGSATSGDGGIRKKRR